MSQVGGATDAGSELGRLGYSGRVPVDPDDPVPALPDMETVEALAGLVEGIAIDERISPAELSALARWLDDHAETSSAALFEPMRRRVGEVLARGHLSPEEHAELLTDCHEFGAKHTPTHPSTREAFARLQGVALGLLADGRVDDVELQALRRWLDDYEVFRQHFVFESFFRALDDALAHGRISEEARVRVHRLCETFAAPPSPRGIPKGFTPAPGPYDLPRPERRWPPLPELERAAFVTLDLETASADPASVCAMGMAAVRAGKIVGAGAELIDPHTRFDPLHTRLHGIDSRAVRGAGEFCEHWRPLAPELAGRWLLAHNATFTARCLRALWGSLGPEVPEPPRLLCTLRLARAMWPRLPGHALERLAQEFDLSAPRHNPHVGARCCAELALLMCAKRGQEHPSALARELDVQPILLG